MYLTALKTCRISEDAHVIRLLQEGETYDIAELAGCALLHNKDARKATNEEINSYLLKEAKKHISPEFHNLLDRTFEGTVSYAGGSGASQVREWA